MNRKQIISAGLITSLLGANASLLAGDDFNFRMPTAMDIRYDLQDINDIKGKNPAVGNAVENLYTGALGAMTSGLAAPEKERAAAAERKLEVAKIGAWGDQATKFFTNRNVMIGLAAAAAGIFGTYYFFKTSSGVAGKYIESKMGKPNLVQETSKKSITQTVWEKIFGSSKKPLSAKDIVLPTELKKDFLDIVKSSQSKIEHNLEFSHVLFYGPPGTGKTLGAKIISQMTGMDYAIVAGSSFTQFEAGKDIQELDKIIRWGRSSAKGLVLFIDEADSALGVRKGENQRADNLVNFFLSNFEKTTDDKIMLVLATNHPERLDPAVMSRLSQNIYIGLPESEERLGQLQLNMGKIFAEVKDKKTVVVDSEVSERLQEIAEMTSGFTGRDLFDLVNKFYEAANLQGASSLSWEMAEKTTQKQIRRVEARNKMQGQKDSQSYFNPNQ